MERSTSGGEFDESVEGKIGFREKGRSPGLEKWHTVRKEERSLEGVHKRQKKVRAMLRKKVIGRL